MRIFSRESKLLDLLLIAFIAVTLAGCGGGKSNTLPPIGGSGDYLAGYVKDSSGLPVSGASIIVDGSETGFTTDISGFFKLNHPNYTVPKMIGTHQITIVINGVILFSKQVIVSPGANLVIKALDGDDPSIGNFGTLQGTVRSAGSDSAGGATGAPLPGANVLVISEQGTLVQTVSGADGTYLLERVPAFPSRVLVVKEGYKVHIEQLDIFPGQTIIKDFVLMPLSPPHPEGILIHGQVVAGEWGPPPLAEKDPSPSHPEPWPWPNGTPVEGARVDIYIAPHNGDPTNPPPPGMGGGMMDTMPMGFAPPPDMPQGQYHKVTFTGPDGRFRFDPIPNVYGFFITVQKEGYFDYKDSIVVEGRNDIEILVALRPVFIGRVIFHVRDQSGAPLPQTFIGGIKDPMDYWMPPDDNPFAGQGETGAYLANERENLDSDRFKDFPPPSSFPKPPFPPESGMFAGFTDWNGDFVVENIGMGHWLYLAFKPGYLPYFSEFWVNEWGPTEIWITLTDNRPMSGSVSGSVMSIDGSPVSKAMVELLQYAYAEPGGDGSTGVRKYTQFLPPSGGSAESGSGESGQGSTQPGTPPIPPGFFVGYTDENGYVRFEGVPEGYWTVHVAKEGFEDGWSDVQVYPGQESSFTMVLNPYPYPGRETTVHGAVYEGGFVVMGEPGGDGGTDPGIYPPPPQVPVPGAHVWFSGPGNLEVIAGEAVTDREGRFTVTLMNGEYTVGIEKEGYYPYNDWLFASGGTMEVAYFIEKIPIDPTRKIPVSGHVYESDFLPLNYFDSPRPPEFQGTPIPGVLIEAVRPDGTLFATATTDDTGYYTFELAGGPYELRLTKDGYYPTFWPLFVDPNYPQNYTDVVLYMSRGGPPPNQ